MKRRDDKSRGEMFTPLGCFLMTTACAFVAILSMFADDPTCGEIICGGRDSVLGALFVAVIMGAGAWRFFFGEK